MKKIFSILISAMFCASLKGQVVVNLQLPVVGLSVKTQLWNIAITNTGTAPLSLKIKMIMTDIATGQQVLSGSTGFMEVPQGNKILQYADVLPVDYIVINSSYNINASPDGFLPLGNFNICYEILKVSQDAVESIAEECATGLIEPVSPPYLNTPADQTESDEIRPLFTWLPPAPVTQFSNLTYNLKLVEVFPGQNSGDAIQQNIPLLTENNITSPSLVYPPSQTALDTGKLYAWQVVANSNSLSVSSSEIWTFRVNVYGSYNLTNERKQPFLKLKTEAAASYFICQGILQVEYENELNDSTVTMEIYDLSAQGIKKVRLDDDFIALKIGQNLISLDLTNISGIMENHQYTVEITNSAKEVWRGRFIYKPTN